MNKRSWVLWLSISIVLVLGIILSLLYINKEKHKSPIPSYFSYSEAEILSLKKLSTNEAFSVEKLSSIDDITYTLVRKYGLGDAYVGQVFAYLYNAQRDAAALSYDAKGSFQGNPEIISSQILCLFFTQDCKNGYLSQIYFKNDDYSEKLSQIVYNKYKKRFLADSAQVKRAPDKIGKEWWNLTEAHFGQDVGSWLPWSLKNVTDFTSPPPPDPSNKAFWQEQVTLTKNALHNITKEQTEKVVFWAGGPGTLTPPGIWTKISNDYMTEHNIPFAKFLLIRAQLASAMEDACIAVFHSKYLYWIQRPYMQDASIVTIMPTPAHPSYPAGHSTISAAAAEILSFYLPENTQVWQKLADEASNSRIWGGIHFQIDAIEGNKLGKKVAKQTEKDNFQSE